MVCHHKQGAYEVLILRARKALSSCESPQGHLMKKDWFRVRGYLHFDARHSESSRLQIQTYVSSPLEIARHSFHPFLIYQKEKPKFFYNDVTKKREFKMGYRPICYASHLDAHIYSFYSYNLSDLYERKISSLGLGDSVIGFRRIADINSGKSKNNIHFANEAFNEIQKRQSCKVFAFDIKSFFDSLDASVLKDRWCSLLNVSKLPNDHYKIFRSLTKYSVVKRDSVLVHFLISRKRSRQMHLSRICTSEQFRKEVRGKKMIEVIERGIPQGSPISATLANIYMMDFDAIVSDEVKALGGSYFRYCDDILIILPFGNNVDIESFINSELSKIKLSLNITKTDKSIFYMDNGIQRCDQPIQYLGFSFDGRSKSLRSASISYFRKKVKKSINKAVATSIKKNEERVKMGLLKRPVFLKKVIRKSSHLGRRNFISYGHRAFEIMNSEAIRLQLADLQRFLENEIKWARSVT